MGLFLSFVQSVVGLLPQRATTAGTPQAASVQVMRPSNRRRCRGGSPKGRPELFLTSGGVRWRLALLMPCFVFSFFLGGRPVGELGCEPRGFV